MVAVSTFVPASRGSLEIRSYSDDLVEIRVKDEFGTLEATGTACASVLHDLCEGAVSALDAGAICFARSLDGDIQLRVIHRRYTAQIDPVLLDAALGQLLAKA